MKRLDMKFDYFTNEADAPSDDEQADTWDSFYENSYTISSSPTARGGIPNFDRPTNNDDSQMPPTYPGAHALETLNMYLDLDDDEEPPTDDSPPEGVAVEQQAADISADPKHSTSPGEPDGTTDGVAGADSHGSRNSSNSSRNINNREPINLREFDAAARDYVYEQAFSTETTPLKKFQIPSTCDDYPEYADEILAAYVKYTTFTVKIWANYDSATKKLYRQDSRVQTCGKVQLPAKSRQYLEQELKGLQFSNVQLLIGNPFRTLFKVDLHAESGQLQVTGRECHRDVHAPHGNLRWVVREAMNIIERDGITPGRFALTLEDLENIAKEFVILPKTQSDVWKYFLY